MNKLMTKPDLPKIFDVGLYNDGHFAQMGKKAKKVIFGPKNQKMLKSLKNENFIFLRPVLRRYFHGFLVKKIIF